MIGGQFDLNSYSVDTQANTFDYTGNNTKSLGIAPQFGYFIFKHTAVGLELLYNREKSSSSTEIDFSRTFSFVPFLRYYIGKGKVKPYLHTGMGPGWMKTKNGYLSGFPDDPQYSKLLIWEIKGGVEFLINKHIGFDFGFGYNSTTAYFKNYSSDWENVSKGTTGTAAIIIHL